MTSLFWRAALAVSLVAAPAFAEDPQDATPAPAPAAR